MKLGGALAALAAAAAATAAAIAVKKKIEQQNSPLKKEVDSADWVPQEGFIKPREKQPAPVEKAEPAPIAEEPTPEVAGVTPITEEPAPEVAEVTPIEEEPAAEIAEVTPIVEEPAAEIAEVTPIAEEPAPEVEEVAPIEEEPAPEVAEVALIAEEPAPEVAEVAPIAEVPAPEITEVSPIAEEVAPEVEKVMPIEEEPAPEVEEVAPIAEEPAPEVEEIAPIAEEPTPEVEEVTPIAEEPAPEIAEVTPIAEEPAAEVAEVTPIAEEPVSEVEEVAPMVEEPAPEVAEVAPIVEEPTPEVAEVAPIVEEPVPEIAEVAPIAEEPAPEVAEVAPIVEEPTPEVEEVTPIAEEPAPEVAEVAPIAEEPVPEVTPIEEEPVPEVAEVVPIEEEPTPEITPIAEPVPEITPIAEEPGYFDNSLIIPADEPQTEKEDPQELIDELSDDIIKSGEHKVDFFDMPEKDDTASIEDLFGEEEPEEPVAPLAVSPDEIFNITPSQPTEQTAPQPTSNLPEHVRLAARDIADHIDMFVELLEPMWRIKAGKTGSRSGVFFDWEIRINALIGSPDIKSYWKQNFMGYDTWEAVTYQQHAAMFLEALESAGVVRSEDSELVFDRYTLKYYTARDVKTNSEFQSGDLVEVVTPCWKLNGEPLVMGEIKPKAVEAGQTVTVLDTLLEQMKTPDGEYEIPINAENFKSTDLDLPFIKEYVAEGKCRCAVKHLDNGDVTVFFYELVEDGISDRYGAGTYKFEAVMDKNGHFVGRFRSEKV